LKAALRWVAVLPAALLATIVVMFPVHWGVQGLRYYEGEENSFMGTPLDTLERFADAFFVPYAFLFVGSYVAPRFKLITTIVLLIVLISGVTSAVLWLHSTGRYLTIDSWFGFAIRVILWTSAASAALVQARQAHKDAQFERAVNSTESA
jgi:hypothetical protein